MRRSLPVRKLTPDEIGELINEDEFNLPILAQSPVAGSPDQALSAFNGNPDEHGGGPDRNYAGGHTEMRSCAAEHCTNYESGHCRLSSIDVNEFGGCSQYQASADGVDGRRYDETETESPTGDDSAVTSMAPDVEQPRPTNGPWDPRGGGY